MACRLFLSLATLLGLLEAGCPARSQTVDPDFQATVAYRAQSLPGTVQALCRQADGRLLVAGDFTRFNNWPSSNVVRLRPDGRVDSTFLAHPVSGGSILAVATDAQDRVLIAGTFTTVDGQPRSRVARLLADGTLDPAFAPDIRPAGGLPAAVRAVVVQPDGNVVLGGSFVTDGANGSAVAHLARLLPTGRPDPGFVPAMPYSGQVGALLLLPTGELLVAGNTYSSAVGLELVRRLRPNGSLDPGFNIVPANQVLAGIGLSMAPTPTGFVLVGAYYSVGNVARASVARFLADGTLDMAFTSPLPNGVAAAAQVGAVAVEPGGQVIIGGDLGPTGTASHLRRLLPDGAFDPGYFGPAIPEPDAVVNALLLQPDGKLLVGGNFTSLAGYLRFGLVRLLAPTVLATAASHPTSGVAIFPNPAHSQLFLRFDAAHPTRLVQLLDALGRSVRTQAGAGPELTLDTAGLPAGSYLLRIADEQDTTETRRIILE